MDSWRLFLRFQPLLDKICFINSLEGINNPMLRILVRVHIYVRDHWANNFRRALEMQSSGVAGRRDRIVFAIDILSLLSLQLQYVIVLCIGDRNTLAGYFRLNPNLMFLDMSSPQLKFYTYSFILFGVFQLIVALFPVSPRELYFYNIPMDIMDYNPQTDQVAPNSTLALANHQTRVYLKGIYILIEFLFLYQLEALMMVLLVSTVKVTLDGYNQHFSWCYCLIRLLFNLTGNYGLWVMVHNALVAVSFLFLVSGYYVSQFDALNDSLARYYRRLARMGNDLEKLPSNVALYRYMLVHNALVIQMNAKRNNWRTIMFLMLAFNLPINVIWFRVLVKESQQVNANMLRIGFVSQIMVIFLCVYCFAMIKNYGVAALATIDGLLYLPKRQVKLRFKLVEVLKIQSYRARLVDGNIGIQMIDGNVAIDISTFLQVLVLYIGFNIMALSDLNMFL